MRTLLGRLVPALVALALLLQVAGAAGEPAALLTAALALGCAAAWAASGLVPASRGIGRAAARVLHRDAMRADAAPRHPGTAGRPRPRAPGAAVPAA
jgi:hypothetical protein